MLREAVNVLEVVSPQISFISSILTFLGGGYVALHSRIMPKWMVTCLWYIGLAGLLNAITMIIGWVLGPMHPLSHTQLGVVTSMMTNAMLAVAVTMLFINTVWIDYQGAKARRLCPPKPAPAKKTRVPATTPGTRARKTVTAKKALSKQVPERLTI